MLLTWPGIRNTKYKEEAGYSGRYAWHHSYRAMVNVTHYDSYPQVQRPNSRAIAVTVNSSKLYAPPTTATGPVDVCIVGRTYAPQTPTSEGGPATNLDRSITQFLSSLFGQTSPNWHVVLVNTDIGRPYPYFGKLKYKYGRDPRFTFVDHDMKLDTNQYEQKHLRIYEITDKAIELCPPEAKYFIATNCDNFYMPETVELVAKTANEEQVDLIGFGFFSRYAFHRPRVMPSEPDQMSCSTLWNHTACVPNHLIYQQCDLGSLAFSLKKWRQSKIQFSKLQDVYPFPLNSWGNPDLAAADGWMTTYLIEKLKWRITSLDFCLLDHYPSPWSCFLAGKAVYIHAYTSQERERFECVDPKKIPKQAISQGVYRGLMCAESPDVLLPRYQ